jgi:hypothetical protein
MARNGRDDDAALARLQRLEALVAGAIAAPALTDAEEAALDERIGRELQRALAAAGARDAGAAQPATVVALPLRAQGGGGST